MFLSYIFQSTHPRDSTKCDVSNLCISEYPHELHDLHKDYRLHLNASRQKKTYLVTINVTWYNMKDSANLHPSSSQIYTTKGATLFTTTT